MVLSTSTPGASGAVGFLDLPPELRNRIYELALIVRHPDPVICVGYLHVDQWRISKERYPSSLRQLKMTPSILATCRQVQQEASPVLYGNNPFLMAPHASSLRYLPNSTPPLPKTFRAIRTVKLCRQANQTVVKSLLLILQNMLNLDALCINGGLRHNFRKPDTMAKALLPLVKSIHARRKGGNQKQAIDVIKFYDLVDFTNWSTIMDVAFARKVKAILRESLDLA
ncbi:hypothetical protein CKM354_001076500 [Cercospora kikuchii]|uniref:2EXR domain-containing protein n=1 Tax=Cercospora kikuchii TaxID=84275 RepID=A0A9P3CXG5_9PEZI|nr:uncharacterized protein CKM354_001076500 [Cercospora kikuchii]GIZ47680.1 hypothetical protein CKM354_001076500 [Cercospora kikuchii]